MEVKNPNEYILALLLAQNAFLDKVSIRINNTTGKFSKTINKDIRDGINGVFSGDCGFFPAAQTRAYSGKIFNGSLGLKAQVHLNVAYMSSEKERNDFMCIAAEIGELLMQECGEAASDMDKIQVFANWVGKYFTYKKTSNYQDHSAIALLKKRTGVCQAIAALAVVVLPYMGIRTQYIIGKGKGKSGWGNHAWNVVYAEGHWLHVDFTFAMNSLRVPMTNNKLNSTLFRNNHRWEETVFTTDALWNRHYLSESICKGEIILFKNREYMMMNEVKIYTESPVYYEKNHQEYIRFYDVMKYLGGGCELDTTNNLIRICTKDKVYSIQNAPNMIEPDMGGIDKSVLCITKINNVEENGKLMFRFT